MVAKRQGVGDSRDREWLLKGTVYLGGGGENVLELSSDDGCKTL